jgi:hypothetical protein
MFFSFIIFVCNYFLYVSVPWSQSCDHKLQSQRCKILQRNKIALRVEKKIISHLKHTPSYYNAGVVGSCNFGSRRIRSNTVLVERALLWATFKKLITLVTGRIQKNYYSCNRSY